MTTESITTTPAAAAAGAPLPADATGKHQETTAVLGMTIFMASWAMLFASLFFAYAVTRVRAVYWPPPDLPALPRGLPALATVAIGGASFALQWARNACRRDGRVRVAALGLALLAAIGFLVLQVAVWLGAWRAGLRPQSGTYASVFYGLTMFHGLHVLIGIAALGGLALRTLGHGTTRGALGLRLWTLYFHMVAVLWLVMFVGVFLL
jgi:cytochrome c oxidase subunit III